MRGIARLTTQSMNQSGIPLLPIPLPHPPSLSLRKPQQPPGLRHAESPFFDLAEHRQPPTFRYAHRKCFHPAGLPQPARG